MQILSLMKATVRIGVVGTVLLGLGACASMSPEDPDGRQAWIEANDPLEPMNRYFFELNRGLDQLLIFPIADTYRGAVPAGIRDSVRNFLDNLLSPVILANDLLQGNVDRASQTWGRFLTNTFVGVGGLFDVSDIEKHGEDFGQTLAVWGVEEGFYLVLPILGPRPPRDLVGLGVDSFLLDPVYWWARSEDAEWLVVTRFVVDGIDFRARNIETLDEIEQSSIDFYATIRSLYRQRRDDEIRNGAPAPDQMASAWIDDLEHDDSIEGKASTMTQ